MAEVFEVVTDETLVVSLEADATEAVVLLVLLALPLVLNLASLAVELAKLAVAAIPKPNPDKALAEEVALNFTSEALIGAPMGAAALPT
jgi:hypothetical protein